VNDALAPTVAVIGGGQLARMLAEPAAALGIPLRLLAEAEGVSAAQVIPDHTVGDYRDLETLRAVTKGCAVVTFDHEHVPTDHLHALEAELAVRPVPRRWCTPRTRPSCANALPHSVFPVPATRWSPRPRR
jgi:5-(carboxyamino)imidazole ribonucleotide synthase